MIATALYHKEHIDGNSLSLLLPNEQVYVYSIASRSTSRVLGRIAAKKAVARYAEANRGKKHSYIEIARRQDGSPYVVHDNSLHLSIAHSDECAIAAVCGAEQGSIGVDIERISRFDPALRAAFLASDERAWVEDAGSEHESQKRAALLWCTKEAYLKTLGVGLKKDPRRIIILHPGLASSNIAIVDHGAPATCSVFWSMAYYGHVIVGLNII